MPPMHLNKKARMSTHTQIYIYIYIIAQIAALKKKKSGASRPSYNARRAKGVWKEQGREKTHQKVENYFKRGVPHRKLRCSLSCVLIRFPVLHCCRV
jgi:hypothetical protein